MDFARALWLRIETLHAVTYFGEETTEAGRSLGLGGFWAGYFGFRAAPLGPVGSGVVEATFFNFAPGFVRRWVPGCWDAASPEAMLTARSEAATRTLTRLCPDLPAQAAGPNAALAEAVARGVGAGRPLFAANRSLTPPDDPVASLWQLCTSLREHRGDGHVAALTACGVDGIEAHVLITLEHGHAAEDIQRTRGWSAGDWSDAVDRCARRGWVGGAGTLTAAGRQLRADVEATTDRLAATPFERLDAATTSALVDALTPAAEAVSRSGVIRYPNPMSLPAVHERH